MKKAIILIFMSITAFSCSDSFTELAPTSNRNGADFYNTANDFEAAINSSYSGLQDNGVYGKAYWTMFEMRSDNSDQGLDATGLARQFTEINQFTESALNEQVGNAWDGSYKVIANCNAILDRIDAADIDATIKSRITGEALFLRSLMYYHLAVAFGNIPLQLTPFVPGDKLSQVPAATIYAQLIIDLKISEENLSIFYTGSQQGKATKGAAATLLAKIQLTIGANSDAETTLRRIISNYEYSLEANYSDLWGVANENNGESIFEVQYLSGGIGQGSTFTNDFSPSGNLQTGQGFGRNRPTATLETMFEAGDARFSASMGTSYVDEDGDTITANYVTKYHGDHAIENDSDINFVVFRYSDVLLMLAEAIGESSESYSLINQVRARAGLADIDGSTPDTFSEKLLKERQVELAFENHRWADLLRFGVAAEKVNAAESFIATSSVKKLYFIPQSEMDINPDFNQN